MFYPALYHTSYSQKCVDLSGGKYMAAIQVKNYT